jgi:hypothetical protein
MSTYLIDCENVHHHGIAGIQNLAEDNTVVLFYGKTNKSIPFESAKDITLTKARVEWIKSEITGKNYLDIQLICYLALLVCEERDTEFYIISKDKGYGSAMDFWSARKPNITFKQQQTISGEAIKENQQKKAPTLKPAAVQTAKSETIGQEPKKPQVKENKTAQQEQMKSQTKKIVADVFKKHNLQGPQPFNKIYNAIRTANGEKAFIHTVKQQFPEAKYEKLGEDLLPAYQRQRQK